MAYHLKYVRISNFTWPLNLMLTQRNVRYGSVCVEWTAALTAGQIEAPVRSLALKTFVIFAHTDKSNTYFKYVKTLRLFVCTHNNNETLCFCKIKQTGCAYSRLGLCELEHETPCISLP